MSSEQLVTAQVKKMYNSIPYESYGVDFSVLLKSVPVDYLNNQELLKNARVLEVGCGAGHISIYLASIFGSVVGVDISEKSLEFAKTQAQKSNIGNVQFKIANLFDPDFINTYQNYFDYILCYGVLHHTHDPEKGYIALSKLLKPGGVLTVGVYSRTMWMYRLKRKIVLLLAKDNWEKREQFAKKLFARSTRDVTVFDSYVHPQVSFHSIGQVIGWVQKSSLSYLGSWPPVEIGFYWQALRSALSLFGKMKHLAVNAQGFAVRSVWFWLVELIWIAMGKSVMINITARKE